ncbi:hypothetical protein L1281_002398 [Neisseria sp. HSC-16F19]|nr:hypothetical protein [Neisseria sp. HSC-16F19]MCP2041782.1 hypothetical protein [Neisseria sp. HSC-16F19]
MLTPEQDLAVELFTTRDALRYVAENLTAYNYRPDLAACNLLLIAEQLSRQIEQFESLSGHTS